MCGRFYVRLQSRRTGFSRESGISNEGDAATALTPSRLKPVLRTKLTLWQACSDNFGVAR